MALDYYRRTDNLMTFLKAATEVSPSQIHS